MKPIASQGTGRLWLDEIFNLDSAFLSYVRRNRHELFKINDSEIFMQFKILNKNTCPKRTQIHST